MNEIKKLSWVIAFSIAMGFMESAVVIYLRKIYYPDGFAFPLIPVSPDIALVEFLREAATLIMLLSIGVLCGRNASQRLAYFILSFGVWDLFYYVFLKIVLDWPESFLTMDILFLIPVPWVGPVLAPCIVSASMILLAVQIIRHSGTGKDTQLRFSEKSALVTGCAIILFTFMADYFTYLHAIPTTGSIWTLSSRENMFQEIAAYVPQSYSWWIFAVGEALIAFSIASHAYRLGYGK